MRWFHRLFVLASVVFLAGAASAEKFTLKTGEVIEGEISGFRSDGITFRRTDVPAGENPFTKRIPFNEFTEETLHKIVELEPKARNLLGVLINTSQASQQEQLQVELQEVRRPEIRIAEVPRPELADRTGLLGALMSGSGLFIFLVLYGANVYAGFEIGHFRNYPSFLVAGLSAAMPVIVPVIFLCLPRRPEAFVEEERDYTEEVEEEEEEEVEPETPTVQAAAAPAPKPIPPTKYFRRGEFNINRRFIETKFAGFFRAIPSEDERDLHLIIKSARGEFSGRRVLKITNTELTFQIPHGESATVDEVIPLTDIFEIQIRHRDATD